MKRYMVGMLIGIMLSVVSFSVIVFNRITFWKLYDLRLKTRLACCRRRKQC